MRVRALTAMALLSLAGCASEDVGSNDLAVTRCGQTTVTGIDVYHGDNGGNPIDWTKAKGDGISFAFVKATEGTTFVDSAFATNWPGLKAAGLKRGAYHFFHADLDPVAEANFFLATVGDVEPGDMLALDLETTDGQTQSTIMSNALTFLQTVQAATGAAPVLYTSPFFLSSFGGLAAFPLWIANWGVSCPNVPAEWTTYTFWQSSDTGSLPSISGALDMDSFNGTLADLDAFGVPMSDASAGDAASDAAGDVAASDGAGDGPVADDDASAKDDADAGATPPDSSGCGCSSANRRASTPWWAGAALLALARRRRVRGRSDRVKKGPWTTAKRT